MKFFCCNFSVKLKKSQVILLRRTECLREKKLSSCASCMTCIKDFSAHTIQKINIHMEKKNSQYVIGSHKSHRIQYFFINHFEELKR